MAASSLQAAYAGIRKRAVAKGLRPSLADIKATYRRYHKPGKPGGPRTGPKPGVGYGRVGTERANFKPRPAGTGARPGNSTFGKLQGNGAGPPRPKPGGTRGGFNPGPPRPVQMMPGGGTFKPPKPMPAQPMPRPQPAQGRLGPRTQPGIRTAFNPAQKRTTPRRPKR
jgi:hypothetical protein